MEGCKSLATPGRMPTASSTILNDGLSGCGVQSVKPGCGIRPVNPEPLKLDRQGMGLYRSAVARCNYLAADRYEITFTTKELCRSMSSPSFDDSGGDKETMQIPEWIAVGSPTNRIQRLLSDGSQSLCRFRQGWVSKDS